MGAVVLGYLFAQLGSIPYALGHQEDVNLMLQGKQALLFQLARLVIVAVVLLLVRPATGTSRPWVWLLAAGITLVFLPFGSRALVLLSVLTPLALYHLVVRPIRMRWLIAGGAVASLGFFTLGVTRLLNARRLEQAGRVFIQRPVSVVHFGFNAVGEFKIFDAATIVVRDVPRVIPYNYGVTFARVPWMIVPRRLWVDKPVTSGRIIVRKYLPNLRTAYPPTAIGELFSAGGWLAVSIGFFGLGWISRVVWEWHKGHRGSGNAGAYLLYCFFVFDFIRVGDPSRTIWFLVIGVVMTAAAFWSAARISP